MSAVPLYFGPRERSLFGWLHRKPESSRLGLVVCNPFGHEAICAHRSLRHFAQAAAAAGIPALRFDYDGTGDSAGDDRDGGRLAAWVTSVHHAIDALRRVGGVERVALLGVRLGALVGTLAGVERGDLDAIVAIAPVVTGKAHLRELRALQMSLGLREPPAGAAIDDSAQEVIGFAITAETRAALGEVDLTRLEKPPAPAVLLLERDDLPGNDTWPARLTSQGVAVDRRRLPGYVDMMLSAQHAVVPETMVDAVAEWLRGRAEGAVADEPVAAPRVQARIAGAVVESAHFVDDGHRLFGVLTSPATPLGPRRGLLLLNAGAVHHVGSNRLYVTLARRWAGLGHAVLRLDMSGIGDSPPRPGEPENVVYGDSAGKDIAAALAFLRRQPGVVEVHALGLCSGGYNAFKAAVAGLPLDGVLLINPLTFFYKPGMSLDPLAEHQVTYETERYKERLRSLDGWMKVARGDVNLGALVPVVTRRIGHVLRDRARDVARRAGIRIGDDLALELEAVAHRKVALRFLFSGGDPGLALLRAQGGATVERLRRRGQLAIDVIEGPDHTFTPVWSHAPLIATLIDLFDGPLSPR